MYQEKVLSCKCEPKELNLMRLVVHKTHWFSICLARALVLVGLVERYQAYRQHLIQYCVFLKADIKMHHLLTG